MYCLERKIIFCKVNENCSSGCVILPTFFEANHAQFFYFMYKSFIKSNMFFKFMKHLFVTI